MSSASRYAEETHQGGRRPSQAKMLLDMVRQRD
jgi:hypothetical protein